MRLQNDALNRLRDLMQERCVFDLSSLNNHVTLCLPEHRDSKDFGGIRRVISLKDKSWARQDPRELGRSGLKSDLKEGGLDESELGEKEVDRSDQGVLEKMLNKNELPSKSLKRQASSSEQSDELPNEGTDSSPASESSKTKKLTKIMTLRLASRYIAMLGDFLLGDKLRPVIDKVKRPASDEVKRTASGELERTASDEVKRPASDELK